MLLLFPAVFDYEKALQIDNAPIHFYGEMVFPWMLEDYACLQPFKHVAQELAEFPSWASLYNEERLRICSTVCAAMIHVDDMYVDAEFSQNTARLLPRMKVGESVGKIPRERGRER